MLFFFKIKEKFDKIIVTFYRQNTMINLNKLQKKREQISAGYAIIEGDRLIRQIIENDVKILDIYTWQENPAPAWLGELKPKLISKKKFFALASTKTPQQYLAVADRTTNEIGDYQTLLYLDQISDPGNLGTIIRTALALGISGIALSPGSCDPFNSKVIRSSLGAVFTLPLEVKTYQWLQEQPAQKILADLDGVSIYDLPPLDSPKILILGSEAAGVSPQLRELSDLAITIPITSKMESLNLAIAAGICLSHIHRL